MLTFRVIFHGDGPFPDREPQKPLTRSIGHSIVKRRNAFGVARCRAQRYTRSGATTRRSRTVENRPGPPAREHRPCVLTSSPLNTLPSRHLPSRTKSTFATPVPGRFIIHRRTCDIDILDSVMPIILVRLHLLRRCCTKPHNSCRTVSRFVATDRKPGR